MERIVDYKNNCTLVAIREITGRSDEAVLAVARHHGYRDNRGMYLKDYMDAARALGVQFGEMKYCVDQVLVAGGGLRSKRLSLGVMLKKLSKGTFFLRTRAHVLVVRDGKMVDTNYHRPALRRECFDYVEVLNPFTKPKTGFLKYVRRPGSGCQFGSRNWEICKAAHDYLAANENVTAEQLLKNCPHEGFNRAYLNWEMKRGNIVEV